MTILGGAATDWEEKFRRWSKPSSDTELTKAENAERMIRNAIAESDTLSERTIQVFAQGSYRNNTNVRQDSDVDICVLCSDVYFPDYSMAQGADASATGFSAASYSYAEFKNEVEGALVAKFGRSGVGRGNKAFDVHPNGYRVDADVVPCFEHRRFTHRDGDGRWQFLTGTEFRPDQGGRVVNWPHQHYANGVSKNTRTGNRFKYLTRALKRLRNEMNNVGISAAAPIPSYLIECLVWNAPDEDFGYDEYMRDMREILAATFNATLQPATCSEWGEVSELKYLFRPNQPWTLKDAHAFLSAAWDYVGFS